MDSGDGHIVAAFRRRDARLHLRFKVVTYHHWRVFANGSGGVCVQFDRDALLKAVRKVSGIQAEEVTYLKLNEIRGRTLKVADLPFLKRYPFENEDEFRIIYTSSKRTLPALDIPVPLAGAPRGRRQCFCGQPIYIGCFLLTDLTGRGCVAASPSFFHSSLPIRVVLMMLKSLHPLIDFNVAF